MEGREILGIVTPGLAVIFAGAFLCVWLANREQTHIKRLALAYFMLAFGFGIAAVFYNTEPRVSLYLCGCLTLSAFLPFSQAIFTRLGKSAPMAPLILLLIVSSIANAFTIFWADSVRSAFAVSSITAAMQVTIIALSLYMTKRRSFGDQFAPWVLIITTGLFFAQVGYSLHSGLPGIDFDTYQDDFQWAALNLNTIFLSTILAINLTILTVADVTSGLRKKATIDELSNLLRRGEFEAKLEELFTSAALNGGNHSLIVCDIDHFKKVNDQFGHQAGDQVIADFGNLITTLLREGDIAGRIGGEEFAILVRNSNEKTARLFAEQLREAFAHHTFGGPLDGRVLTASFGTAQSMGRKSYRAIFADADRALYTAKARGRNMVCDAASDWNERRQIAS